MQHTTRIAPSPTGMFHLGTARTAYINWLAARASGGKFILRIDDTDTERNKDEYTKVILDSLEWLGLDWDELWYQSGRTVLYNNWIDEFILQKQAKELDNGAIALLCPETLPKSFRDTISGDIPITETNKQQIHEIILMRGGDKLGQYTYQFCSAVDDYMDINWIIRGHDHITNTPKQIAIWKAMNWENNYVLPQFTHLGLIFHNKQKLSKRDGAASLLWYKEQGYSPEAMLNFMLRLGWSPKGDNKEHQFINRNRALELFFQGNLSNRPCNYELAKLDALQRHYNV